MSDPGEVLRRPLIAANWKMHKTARQAVAFVEELLPELEDRGEADVAICAPYLALQATVEAARGSPMLVYAQNMHHAAEGAYTGEVSPSMLVDVGVQGVILGHSERRQMFGENDRELAMKVPAALKAGLVPLLCVGESEDERDSGETQRRLRHQVQEDLAQVPDGRLAEVVIAYEPIWAIGTGKVATPDLAQEAIAFVRALVGDRSREQAQRIRVLYGGSVKPENAAELLGQADIDGALVGGASLEPGSLAEITAAAAPAGRTRGPAG